MLTYPVYLIGDVRLAQGEFKAEVLDIGQGTAVLIETENHKLLYDTGPIQGKKMMSVKESSCPICEEGELITLTAWLLVTVIAIILAELQLF
ncbi:hypothetical protein [Polynucleobacter necessarius]|uniref:hypothetical protein n=1 Tax=Polynucleobacter necessarius TaxID=576610 RepID=UPI0018D564C8|nr:hypothetical protein [Polynucleobacter necessarius]